MDGDANDLSSLIRWDELTRNADFIPAKHVLFVMDACYSGLGVTRGLAPGSTRFLEEMLQRFARQALAAGKADQPVSDEGGPIPNHSVFTSHLLEALNGGAATPDGLLTANTVMSYVYEKVAKDRDSRQTPHFGFLDGDGDFIFQAPSLNEPTSDSEIGQSVMIEIPAAAPSTYSLQPGEDLVGTLKIYLSDAGSRIKLDDLVTRQIQRFHSLTSEQEFPIGPVQQNADEFGDRLARYETITRDLKVTVSLMARWGARDHSRILSRAIARTADNLDTASGSVIWTNLRWYPIALLLYSGGIAAVSANEYGNLSAILDAQVHPEFRSDRQRAVILPAVDALSELDRRNAFKQVPGHEEHYVPISEYLFTSLQPDLDDILYLGRAYETHFDAFEVFFSLLFADARHRQSGRVWFPLGRFAWKHRSDMRESSPLTEVVREAEIHKDEWPPFKAGLFGGSFDRFSKLATDLAAFVATLRWY